MRKMFGLKYLQVTIVVVIFFLYGILAKKCDDTDLVNEQCSPTEVCRFGKCDCPIGHKRINDTYCFGTDRQIEPTKSPTSSSLVDGESDNGSVVAAVLIPIFILTSIVTMVYVTRRYKLVAWAQSNVGFISWITNKMNQRNSNYDEFMIGQDLDDDDPPLR